MNTVHKLLNNLAQSSFSQRTEIVTLFLEEVGFDPQLLWKHLKTRVEDSGFIDVDTDSKIECLVLFFSFLCQKQKVKLSSDALVDILETFFMKLSVEDFTQIHGKMVHELCAALVEYCKSHDAIKSLFQKALVQLQDSCDTESFWQDAQVVQEPHLTLLHFLNPQSFRSHHSQLSGWDASLSKQLFRVILDSLKYANMQTTCVRILLPNLLQQVTRTSQDELHTYACELCTRLKELIKTSDDDRGLAGLVQFIDIFQKTVKNLSEDEQLLPKLRECVRVGISLNCRRAIYILERIWSEDRHQWKKVFLTLHSSLDEFGLHLVQQDWHKISLLHPAIDQDESTEFTESKLWCTILWWKGFTHKNHQVQRLVLKAFLSRKWTSEFLADFENQNLLYHFLHCLSSAHIQEDPLEPNHQMHGEAFLKTYMESLETDTAKVDLLVSVLCHFECSLHDTSRLAWKSSLSCFLTLSSAVTSSMLTTEEASSILALFQTIVGNIGNFHGAKFKTELYEKIMQSVKTLLPFSRISWSCFIPFLASFPLYLSCPHAILNSLILDWVQHESDFKGERHLQSSFVEMMNYLLSSGSLDECRTISKQLVAVLQLLSNKYPEIILSMVKILKPELCRLYRHTYKKQDLEAKTLLLTNTVFESHLKRIDSEEQDKELEKNLIIFIVEPLDEISSYCSMGLANIATQHNVHFEDTVLALSCLATIAKFVETAKANVDNVRFSLNLKISLLVDGILSLKTKLITDRKSSHNNIEVGSQLLTCFVKIAPGIHKHIEFQRLFQTLCQIVSVSYQDECESLKWKAIHALCSSQKLDDCPTTIKGDLLVQILEQCEFIDESITLIRMQLLHPLLKELYTHKDFTSYVYAKLRSEEHEENCQWLDKLMFILSRIARLVWAGFADSNKNIEICCTLITLIYLPESFHGELFDAAHGKEGPLYDITMKLLDCGSRSPRILLLTTVHLLKGLKTNLTRIEAYLPFFEALITRDSVKDRGQADFGNLLSITREQISDLDEEMILAYQTSTIAPRVTLCCFFYSMANHCKLLTLPCHTVPDSSPLVAVGYRLWKHFLQIALTDELQKQTQYRAGSQTHRAKLRLWQVLTLLSPFACAHKSEINENLEPLMKIVKDGNTSSVRMYVEMTVCSLLISHPEKVRSHILPYLQNYEKRHEALPAYMLIAYQVAMRCGDQELKQQLLREFACAVFPWTMSHNHATRAFAQLTLDALIVHFPALCEVLQRPSVSGGLDLWSNVGKYLIENKELNRLKIGLGSSVRQLQAPGAEPFISVRSVLQALDEKDVDYSGFEAAPEPVIERIQNFVAEERTKVRNANAEQLIAKESGSGHTLSLKNHTSLAKDGSNVQRKITPQDEKALIYGGDVSEPWNITYEHLIQLKEPIYDDQDLLSSVQRKKSQKQGIILVASLIDKVPNLAGLARSCEVFQAEKLVIAHRSLMHSHQFRSISVTAEEWIDIEEVKPVALHPWLVKKHSEGYALLGLEQTSNSKILGKFQFPEKCILVLGREKEGIPVNILQIMDQTIEIPQIGLIRSLNVHVSGAIALYEFTRQKQTSC